MENKVIDTCKFYVAMTDRFSRALLMAHNAAHPKLKVYNNHFYLKHPYGLPAIRINFNLKRREFWLETSLPKVLQGHNVFGSNRLEMLCLSVVKLIYAQLGVEFANDERIIREEGIRLGRLDVTCSFALESSTMVELVQECLYEQLRAEGKAWSAFGKSVIETVYNQQHSERITDKYYDKGKELNLAGRRLPLNIPLRQRILDLAHRLLRFEVTYRGKELADLGLDYADCWDNAQVKAELKVRLNQFNFRGVLHPLLAIQELDGLNSSCRTFYGLWKDGANLNKYRHNRTLHRARQTLLEDHKVDIYRRTKTGCAIPLQNILHPSRAYYTAPKSLVRGGAIFTGR